MTVCNEVLGSSYFKVSSATVEFINFINHIFDILNSCRFYQSGYKRAISPKNKVKIFDFIEKAIANITGLKKISNVKRTIKRQTDSHE